MYFFFPFKALKYLNARYFRTNSREMRNCVCDGYRQKLKHFFCYQKIHKIAIQVKSQRQCELFLAFFLHSCTVVVETKLPSCVGYHFQTSAMLIYQSSQTNNAVLSRTRHCILIWWRQEFKRRGNWNNLKP